MCFTPLISPSFSSYDKQERWEKGETKEERKEGGRRHEGGKGGEKERRVIVGPIGVFQGRTLISSALASGSP